MKNLWIMLASLVVALGLAACSGSMSLGDFPSGNVNQGEVGPDPADQAAPAPAPAGGQTFILVPLAQ